MWGIALKRAGLSVIDAEPALRGMPPETAKRFGYGTYSARTGNIYTVRQFRQLVEEMLGLFTPALPAWERDGRYWDALRPGVEPEGLTSPEQVAEMAGATPRGTGPRAGRGGAAGPHPRPDRRVGASRKRDGLSDRARHHRGGA